MVSRLFVAISILASSSWQAHSAVIKHWAAYDCLACSIRWKCGAARRGSPHLNTEYAPSGVLSHRLPHPHGWEQPLQRIFPAQHQRGG